MHTPPNDLSESGLIKAKDSPTPLQDILLNGVSEELLQERRFRLCQPRLNGAINLFKQFDTWINENQESLQSAFQLEPTIFAKLMNFRETVTELIPLVEKQDPQGAVKAILLFMNLPSNNFDYIHPSSEALNLTSKIPFVIRANSLHVAISQYEKCIANIDQYDPNKVLTAFALGAKIPNLGEQVPSFENSSLFRVLVNLAKTHSRSVYLKADLISEIEQEGVNIKKSDRMEVEKAARFDVAQLEHSDLYFAAEYLKASKPYIECRRALLDQGPIYLKPIDGAGGVGVLKVERTEKGLIFQGDPLDISFIEMSAKGIFSQKRAVMPENNFFRAVFLNQANEVFNDDGEILIDLRDRRDLKPELQQLFRVEGYISGNQEAEFITRECDYYFEPPVDLIHNIITQIGAGRYLLDLPSENILANINFEIDFISNCPTSLEQDRDQYKLTVQVSPEQEENLLHQIDLMMLQRNIVQYAEQAIDAPKFNNHSVEVRVINYDGKPFAHYCKVAPEEGSIVNNVSQGGTSAAFEDVLIGIYRDLLEPEEMEKLTEKLAWTITETNRNACVGASAAEKYFVGRVTKELSGIIAPQLLEDLRLRTCSTDFMFEVIKHETLGKVLNPVMIDSNLAYAFSGLESVNPEAHLALRRKLHRTSFADPLEHIESLFMRMLVG